MDEKRKMQAILNHSLSGLKENPFLSQRIIAQAKGEEPVKKRTISFIGIIAVLLVLAAVAYAATEIYRQINWKGEPVETITEFLPLSEDTSSDSDANISRNEINDIIHLYIDNIPDEDYAEIWYKSQTFTTGNIHQKQKNFTSYEDFLQYMSSVDYLTVPSWLPENMISFSGKVLMESQILKETDANPENFVYYTNEDGSISVFNPDALWGYPDALWGYYKQAEEWENDQIKFCRYILDDTEAIITGYQLTIGFQDHFEIQIICELSTSLGTSFKLESDETATPVTVRDMTDGLLITSPGQEKKDKLFLRRELNTPVSFVSLMKGEQTSSEEQITIMAYDQEPENLIKIFSGE